MYNKSKIMKRAWELYRTAKANERATWFLGEMVVFNKASFPASLKEAWAAAKHKIKVEQEARANGMIKACELKIGDTISVNGFGGYDDVSFSETIVSIEPWPICYNLCGAGSCPSAACKRVNHNFSVI